MLDWIRFILYTSADERRNQPVQSRKKRTSPTSGRLLVDDRSSCCCSSTKDWYSARQTSTSLPLFQPFSGSPSKNLLKSWKGATSSPPITMARQKQLLPCPMTDLEATVERTQFQILREGDWHAGETLSVGKGYQLSLMQPSHEFRRESLSHRLQGTANDSGQRTFPIDLQRVKMMLS